MFPGRIEAFAIRALMSSMGVSLILIVKVTLPNPLYFILILACVEIINDFCTTKIGVK